jgi:hypothetical protein
VSFAVATAAFLHRKSAFAGTFRDSCSAQAERKRENQRESFHSVLHNTARLAISLSHTHNHSLKRCEIYAGKFAIFGTNGELDKWGLIPETFVVIFSSDRSIQQK